MSNIFTPPGTSARNTEVQNQSNAAGQISSLLPGAVGYEKQLQGFQSSQLPNMEQGVQNAYYNTTQGGRNAETQQYGQQQQAAANSAAGQAGSKFSGNPSLAQGYSLDAENQANTNTGNYAAQVNSPQSENNAWGAYMNANNALTPSYGGVGQLAGGVYSQPTVPVGQGLGSFLGTALGSWASGGFPSISGIASQVVSPGISSSYPLGIPPVS